MVVDTTGEIADATEDAAGVRVRVRTGKGEQWLTASAGFVSHWLVGYLTPRLLRLDDRGASVMAAGVAAEYAVQVRRDPAAAQLLHGDVIDRLRGARARIQEDADRAAGAVARVRFLNRDGDVPAFLTARYPALVDAAAAARACHTGGPERVVVDEAYRVCAASICRAHLLAQAAGHTSPRLDAVYDAEVRALWTFAVATAGARMHGRYRGGGEIVGAVGDRGGRSFGRTRPGPSDEGRSL